ncbi:hypothetical protein [Candidatus Microthrix parvicella]|uniref:Uncharacterized protein n=1 Tax=Candidatus Neomicrothrix parvicella RN1 TaxID=1229780 RepID=R4Z0Z3_9ACTN|nr:hypothetical protein [Candidatus Microthrix parvicella]CCM64383.1 conserved hypothetical protein [Candidatus Microthrix parvicella RN1]
MSDGADDLARQSARRLSAQLGIEVEGPVEQAIAGSRPGQYVDPGSIALGALIVSIANLVWTMFNDLRNDRKQPSNDTIARQVRVKVEVPVDVTTDQRDAIIEVVIDDATRTDDQA